MSKGLTTAEILKLKKDNEKAVELFYGFSAWTDEDYQVYEKLLEQLELSYKSCAKENKKLGVTTKNKGDALEGIVNFIIEKSYFLEVYDNNKTATNELDQIVVISDYGKQALEYNNISSSLLNLEGDFFLGECKNYDGKIGVTWIGKFNTLLNVCGNCKLGIIFSYDGLTGKENNWEAAHGLTKVIYTLSPLNEKKYIIDFNIYDFKALSDKNNNFFNILKAKKLALGIGCKSENLYQPHESAKELQDIYVKMIENR